MKLAELNRLPDLDVTAPPALRGAWQQQHVRVDYSFPVVSTHDAFDIANPDFRAVVTLREPQRRHRLAIFLDEGVARAMHGLAEQILTYINFHHEAMELIGDIFMMPGGEACKNDPALVETLLQALSERAIDRHSYAIAIGGGAVLDAVGYASAIFHRGVRHIRFPTTVLAQDDSGVGVKNAVNWQGQKNLIGTFAPPWAVINDAAFIDILPAREKRAGLAEAVKVALIRDHAFFLMMEKQLPALAAFDSAILNSVIARSAGLHMHQIAHGGDPFESGSARPLDYGHWVAHKLERLTAHALSHGEAVAIGLALDARYSCLAGLLPAGEDARIHRLLTQLGFDLWHPQLLAQNTQGELLVLQGLREFREHLGGELTITLLAAIGSGVEVHEMDAGLVRAAIDWLQSLQTSAQLTISPAIPAAISASTSTTTAG
ncbi:3-dehydroquinate synthase [Undibacterium sp. YM2]|uniref:3-dehydroquinate synthase n=1 Tax=Undibacterium sp. YM2 TaxID=2058625 RepID=UPI001331FA0B|nr:3-dehydroquinate synthase [Undibacterium sp. YM2]BBB68926.1 3-dehydroquinate synthase [Undibacterium sp. YM2]